MRKIPDKCTVCKFSYNKNGFKYCGALSGKELDKTFDEFKNNWMYKRPKNCPLTII